MPGGSQTETRDAQVNLQANVGDYSQQMNVAAASTNQAASAVDRLDQRLASLTKTAGKKMINLGRDDFAVLAGATADAAAFQKQLSTLNATAAITGTSFRGIKSGIEQAFEAFPTARGQIVALAGTISDLGVTAPRDIGTLIQTFIKLGAATGEGIQPLAQGLVQLSRQMGTTNAQQIGNYANSLLTVSKNAGVSATGVLSFAQSIAPMARQAGIGEAAVIGISAAFSKAGADGYVAANTFNSIVSDITNLTQTGSPELSKYANLIGVTVSQFKSMDKTTALTDIFNTITKQGPQAINTLNQLGIDGVRAQSAIAAVSQGGGLQAAIATATNSSVDQKNLNKGSAAAFNNLSDGLARLRNEFVEFGSMIGTTFITPISKMVQSLADAGQKLNDFLRPFAPVIAGLAAIAGGLAAVSGAALSVATVIGAVGLAHLAVTAGPVRAMREGISVGRNADTQNVTGAMYAAHTAGTARMPLRTRIPYQMGTYVGRVMPPPVEGEAVPGATPLRQAGRAILRAPFVAATALTRSSTRLSADEAVNDYSRSFYNKNPDAQVGFRATVSNAVDKNKQNTEELTSFQALMAATKELVGAFISAGVQITKTGMAVVRPSNWRTNTNAPLEAEGRSIGSRLRGAGDAVASTAGSIASAGGSLLSSAAGMLGGPLGIGLIAAAAAPSIISMISSHQNQGYEIGGGENAISRYDAALGTSSTALGSFTNAVNNASTAADRAAASAPTTISGAAVVTQADRSKVAAGSFQVTDTQLESVQRGKGSTAAAVQYLNELATQSGGMTPQKLQSIKTDLISIFGPTQAQDILSQYTAGSPSGTGTPSVDYTALGTNLNGQSNGRFRSNVGNTTSTIQSQQATADSTAGNAQALQNVLTFGSAALKGSASQSNMQSIAAQLAAVLGGNASDYNLATGIKPAFAPGQTPGVSSTGQATGQTLQAGINQQFATAGGSQAQILKAIRSTDAGKKYLATLFPPGTDIGKISDADIVSVATNSGRTVAQQDTLVGRISQIGAGTTNIGTFSQRAGGAVQTAVSEPGNVNAQTAGAQSLYNQLSSTGQSFQQISQAMDDFKGAIQNTTDPLYQMADAAKAYAAQQDQIAQQGMSQEGRLADTAQNYQQARQNAATNPQDPTAQADVQTAQANYQQQLVAYNQYQQSMTSAAIAYGVQRQRASEDEGRTIYRQQLAFQIQMTQSQQDFNRQNMIATRDFGIQMARQAQSAAESIYDPFARVQSKYTIDAGTLVQNLADQNQRIQQQMTDLQSLASMGVSQSAIDTLQLSDPNNAQQTQALVQSLMNNPALVQQINSAVASRVAATTNLTQSTFSETFRNTTADFQRQLSDTADAYNIQKQRAVDAQKLSLSQMAQDYNTMVTRSAQDLNQAFTQIYGDYASSYGNALAAINGDIGKYSPDIAAKLSKELTDMHAQIVALGLGPVILAPAVAAAGKGSATSGAHAAGGVSTFAHTASISEGNNAEAIIPLDQRGLQFMTNFANQVAMAQLRQMNTSQYSARPSGSNAAPSNITYKVDQSTNIGTANVSANDTKQIQAEIQKAKRIKALSMPQASTAGPTS